MLAVMESKIFVIFNSVVLPEKCLSSQKERERRIRYYYVVFKRWKLYNSKNWYSDHNNNNNQMTKNKSPMTPKIIF